MKSNGLGNCHQGFAQQEHHYEEVIKKTTTLHFSTLLFHDVNVIVAVCSMTSHIKIMLTVEIFLKEEIN